MNEELFAEIKRLKPINRNRKSNMKIENNSIDIIKKLKDQLLKERSDKKELLMYIADIEEKYRMYREVHYSEKRWFFLIKYDNRMLFKENKRLNKLIREQARRKKILEIQIKKEEKKNEKLKTRLTKRWTKLKAWLKKRSKI